MAALSAVRQTGRKLRPLTGCRRRPAQPAALRPAGIGRNGFLTHAFQPLWVFNGERRRTEREFQNSLSNLCRYYQLPEPETAGFPFPRNIYLQWQTVNAALRLKDGNLRCLIVQQDNGRIELATGERLDLNMDLYYLPVRPVWYWLQEPTTEALGRLILGLMAYLTQKAGIDFYGDAGTYMNCSYEMLKEWIAESVYEDDPDDDATIEYREMQAATFYEMEQVAAKLKPVLGAPATLFQFEQDCAVFLPKDNVQQQFLLVANSFLQLYHQHPDANIYRHTGHKLLRPDEEETMYAEQYTQIFWSPFDVFSEDLDEMINSHFQDVSCSDEPFVLRTFGEMPSPDGESLAFERDFYPLLEQVRNLLIDADKCLR